MRQYGETTLWADPMKMTRLVCGSEDRRRRKEEGSVTSLLHTSPLPPPAPYPPATLTGKSIENEKTACE